MIVAFACAPGTGVIAELFEAATRELAEVTDVVAVVNDDLPLADVDRRRALRFSRPFGIVGPTLVRRLRALGRQDGRTVFFVWTQHPIAAIPMTIVRSSRRVAWWHEPRHRGQVGRVKSIAYRAFQTLVISRADVILVAAPSMLADVPTRYRSRTSVLEFPKLHRATAPSARFDDHPTDLVFFGVLMAHKGLDVLAAALRLLDADGLHPTLRIVGRGTLADVAPAMAELRREWPERIDVIEEYVDAGDLASAIVASRLSVLPYLSAAGTTTTRISHDLGRPVIASDTGSFADEIRDGVDGLLIAPGSAIDLADGLKRALASDRTWVVAPPAPDASWAERFLRLVSAADDGK